MSAPSKLMEPQNTKVPPKKGKARAKKRTEAIIDLEFSDNTADDEERGPHNAKQATASSTRPMSPSKTSPKKKSSKKKVRAKKAALFNTRSMDVVVPDALLAEPTGGECSLLVQIDPQDATLLDFEGQRGAIGRFEAEESGVTLDLKGFQYHGTIYPGPTALVMQLGKTGQLKVDSITDEFLTLRQTQDIMAKLNAIVQGDMDEGYAVAEENVNAKSKVTEEVAPPAKKRKVSGKKKKS